MNSLFDLLTDVGLRVFLPLIILTPGMLLMFYAVPKYRPDEDPMGCLPSFFTFTFWIVIFFLICLWVQLSN